MFERMLLFAGVAVVSGCNCTTAICMDGVVVALQEPLDTPGVYRVVLAGDVEAACTFRIGDDGELDVPSGCEVRLGSGDAPSAASAPMLGPDSMDPTAQLEGPITWLGASVGRESALRRDLHLLLQRDDTRWIDTEVDVDWVHEQPNGGMCAGDCWEGMATAPSADPVAAEPVDESLFEAWDCLQVVGADEEGRLELGPLEGPEAVVDVEVVNACDGPSVPLTGVSVWGDDGGRDPGGLSVPASVPEVLLGPGERFRVQLTADLPPGLSTRYLVFHGAVQPRAAVARLEIDVGA